MLCLNHHFVYYQCFNKDRKMKATVKSMVKSTVSFYVSSQLFSVQEINHEKITNFSSKLSTNNKRKELNCDHVGMYQEHPVPVIYSLANGQTTPSRLRRCSSQYGFKMLFLCFQFLCRQWPVHLMCSGQV